MLKVSDYIATVLAFIGLLLFFLMFQGAISVDLQRDTGEQTIELPKQAEQVNKENTVNPSYVILYGNEKNSDLTQNAETLLANMKREYMLCDTIDNMTEAQLASVTTYIVTADAWESLGTVDSLFQLVEKEGKNLFILSPLNQDEVMVAGEDEADTEEETKTTGSVYNQMVGIRSMEGPVTIDGYMIFEGILVQGEVYYDEIYAQVQDIALDATCKKLIIEKSEEDKEQRDLVPLLWQKRYGDGVIYVLNGDFLVGTDLSGIFTGVLADMEDTFVYPVVNAKVEIVDSFPIFNNPYEGEINRLYSRNTSMFIRDIVWPSLVKTAGVNNLIVSGITDLTEAEMESTAYEELHNMVVRRGFEIVRREELEGFSEFPVISTGHYQNDYEAFKMNSAVSGMGLASHLLDMTEVMGARANEIDYEWSAYSLELSKTVYHLYYDTDFIESVTLSEGLVRYKSYLLSDPRITVEEEAVSIETDTMYHTGYYIIKTDKIVESGQGYTVEKINDGYYLLEVEEQTVQVTLSENESH